MLAVMSSVVVVVVQLRCCLRSPPRMLVVIDQVWYIYVHSFLFFLLFESFFSVFLSPQPYDPMTLFPQQKTMIRMKVIAKIQHGIRVGEVCSS